MIWQSLQKHCTRRRQSRNRIAFVSVNSPSRTPTLFLSRRTACPFLNCDQVSNLFKEFSGKLTVYTLFPWKVHHWKEIYVFINVSWTFYIFFIEFSRKIGKWAWSEIIFLPCAHADFTCGNRSMIQSVLHELLLTVNLWVFEKKFSRNNLSVYCFLFVHL